MSTLNKAMIIGRLGQNPEVRYTQANTAVATLNVATNERFKDSNGEWRERTEWHRIVAWGRLAEICQQYLSKGSQIYVEGPIQTREWEDKEGQKRYTTEIKALTMTMLDSKNNSGGGGGDASGGYGNSGGYNNNNNAPSNQAAPAANKVELDSKFDDMDDELPF